MNRRDAMRTIATLGLGLPMLQSLKAAGVALTLPTSATAPQLETKEPFNFASLRESLTTEILSFEPEEMRMLGHSGAAGKLKNWSQDAIADEVRFCRTQLAKLNSIDLSDPPEILDRAVLAAHFAYIDHFFGHYQGELGNLQISAYPYDVIQ